jgi:5'-3' exonuclease
MSEALPQPLLYLIDALPYVFRAYFAVPEMNSPAGAPVHAVYGFAAFLCQLLRQAPLTHIAVAFDESLVSSFRNAFFPAYKANRQLPPPDLAQQLAYCQAVARALGMAVFVDQQYEADDLIGTLAHQATQAGMPVVIVSNDKDLMQLVNPTVTLYDFARHIQYDPAGVGASMGVRPEQIPDLLGLQGDPVDNIPGVRGVGAKMAVALLQAFPSVEALYARLDEVETLPLRGASALRRKLAVGEAAARLSKRLATIALQAPVSYDAETLRYRGALTTEVTRLFTELGFERLQRRIPRWQPAASPGSDT